MLTRNVSLIESLLNDEKKLLQFLDGKYRQYKDYNDCTLDVRYVGNKPYYSFHRFTWVPPTMSLFRISKIAALIGIFLPFVGTTFRQSKNFFPNIRQLRRIIWENFCQSIISRRNSVSPRCPLLSIRSGTMRC